MVDDVMIFPDTWEEFEKYYGFYDSKQAYMFGNTRLIPSFRVEQWLDHIDDIKRKKQSQKNKMEQVAAMFRKKLGEEFEVNGKYKEKITCQLTEQGLLYLDRNFCGWEDAADYMLTDLLTGEAVIVDE